MTAVVDVTPARDGSCMNGNDAVRALAEVAASHHGVFNKDQAVELNVSTRQLRSAAAKGILRRPLSDVYVFTSHRKSFRQECAIASAAGGTVSHDSAAALHKLDGFHEDASSIVHVSFERNHKRILRTMQVHTWSYTSSKDITTVDGIQCTSIARTLVQLGLTHPRAVVEAALDSALRRGVPAKWIEETLDRLWRPGRTGQQVLNEIARDPARSGALAESVLERIVEAAIRDPELPRPIRQFPIQVASGEKRVDLAFPAARLAIEAHSRRFHFGPAREEADNVRDLELAAAGWEVIYITWGMAHEPSTFLPLVRAAYKQRLMHLRAASGD